MPASDGSEPSVGHRIEESRPNGVISYMAKRGCVLAAGMLSSLVLCCPPAFGVNATVGATVNDVFDPSWVTITQGDTVTWTNDGGHDHNVSFEELSFLMPTTPSKTWTVYNTFTQPGTYHYYCKLHGAAGGIGMAGTVVVNPAPPGGGGGGGGTPGPADTAPVSSLVAASKQHIDRLFVRASMNEPGTLTASGTVAVPGGAAKLYRFKPASKQVSPNVPVKLALKLPKNASRAVKAALRHRRKLSAKVTLTARDATGHQTVRQQTIRLSR
jgi:plastocyanin